MGLGGGEAYSPIYGAGRGSCPSKGCGPAPELAVLASGHPDGHRPGNIPRPQTSSQLAKNNSPFTPWEREARQLPASMQAGPGHPGQECSAGNVTHAVTGTGRRKPAVLPCFPLPSPALSAWERPLPGWGYWEQDPLRSAPLCPRSSSPPGSFAPSMSQLLQAGCGTRGLPRSHRTAPPPSI